MNVAYYALAFDQAVDVFLEQQIGIEEKQVHAAAMGPFALQSTYCYLAELFEGEKISFTARILDFDNKRMHLFCQMIKSQDGTIAATCETLYINVDHLQRRSVPYSRIIHDNIKMTYQRSRHDAMPPQVGQRIGIRRQK